MRPAAVVFDLYGTLADYSSLSAKMDGGRLSGEAFVAAWRTKQLAYAMAATIMERFEDFDDITGKAYAYVAALHGAPGGAAARERAVAAWSTLPAFPDAAEALAKLASLSIPAAVLSNGSESAVTASLEHLGLRDRFAHALSVDSVRRFKPHPDVYALATKAFGCAPADIVFVSSNGWDATGAAEFGFRVVWCNRGKLPDETFGASPEHVISSLGELGALLEN